jgi:hypothetical protein
MLRECLGSCSMRLGAPFIAPRQLGAVGDQHGRLSLPSVEGAPDKKGEIERELGLHLVPIYF